MPYSTSTVFYCTAAWCLVRCCWCCYCSFIRLTTVQDKDGDDDDDDDDDGDEDEDKDDEGDDCQQYSG